MTFGVLVDEPVRPVTYKRVPASILQRLGAGLTDGLLYVCLIAVPATLLGWWTGPAPGIEGCTTVGGTETCLPPPPEQLLYSRVVFWSLTAVWVLLTARSIGRRGYTIGRRATEYLVVDAVTAEPIGFRRALIRTLAMAISAAPLGLGFLWALRTPERLTWHDHIAGTRAISP